MNTYNLRILQQGNLEGERLILRPFTLDDVADLYEITSDEETTTYLFDTHTETERTLNMLANYYIKESIGKYAVVLKETSKLIGVVEFRLHEQVASGELGYYLNRDYWGKGYMTEAGQLILNLAFNVLELNRVFAAHEVENEVSGKLLLRLGFTYEGTLRQHRMAKGKFVDGVHYSILKHEFKHLKG